MLKSLTATQQRIGVFGGAFDPIHIGHLILAEEACFQLHLDAVYFAPTGDPPHKPGRSITPVEQRIHMVYLAIADNQHFRVSRIDADRPGPHYTVDMLRLLHEQQPPNTELYFLMGLDSLRDLPTWRDPQWLVAHCQLVALSRHAVTLDWARLEAALPGLRQRVTILDMPELEIASHTLRERVHSGQPIRYQVPDTVATYIRQHNLYR